MAKPNYVSLLAQLGALQADVDTLEAQRQVALDERNAYLDIINDPNSTAAEVIGATQNAAVRLALIQSLDASIRTASALVVSKEEDAYQFPEPLTPAEEALFDYMSSDYLESNPGSHPPQMEVFNDTLTIISLSAAQAIQGDPVTNPRPDGTLGYFYQLPSTDGRPNYVSGVTDSFLLWLTDEPLIEDAGAHIGAIMTLSSGSNELKMTITSIGAQQNPANMDFYIADFEVSPHRVVGLSYFENLSDNDTLNIKIESPSKSSYVGKYYDDDGIIGL